MSWFDISGKVWCTNSFLVTYEGRSRSMTESDGSTTAWDHKDCHTSDRLSETTAPHVGQKLSLCLLLRRSNLCNLMYPYDQRRTGALSLRRGLRFFSGEIRWKNHWNYRSIRGKSAQTGWQLKLYSSRITLIQYHAIYLYVCMLYVCLYISTVYICTTLLVHTFTVSLSLSLSSYIWKDGWMDGLIDR